MAFMEWSESLSVSNNDIDGDHKRLVELINTLHDAMMQRKGAQLFVGVLDALIDYTKTHFRREEGIMTSHAYPQYCAHKREHDAFVGKVSNLQKGLRTAKWA